MIIGIPNIIRLMKTSYMKGPTSFSVSLISKMKKAVESNRRIQSYTLIIVAQVANAAMMRKVDISRGGFNGRLIRMMRGFMVRWIKSIALQKSYKCLTPSFLN